MSFALKDMKLVRNLVINHCCVWKIVLIPSGNRLESSVNMYEIDIRLFWAKLMALLVIVTFFAPFPGFTQNATVNTSRITLEARLSSGEPAIEKGLEWRIFKTRIDEKGELPVLATATGGTKAFDVSQGVYYIHVAYGYAGAVRRVEISQEASHQVFILDAGGLQLEAITSPNGPISDSLLRFDIYSNVVDARGIRNLIARDVRPMQITPFARGTYHVVSRYGTLNAETRADLRVQAGKVTQATLQHRAARLTFKLVRNLGADAIADTAWSILAENGDVINEVVSTFPSLVLSEGNYTAIVKNADKIYSHDFVVASGDNRDVEVLAE